MVQVPASAPVGQQADRIVIEKAAGRMTLLRDGQPLCRYRVATGSGGPGPKRREGDRLTPEGTYHIAGRNPRSAYHLSLRISYPAPADRAAAEARGENPGCDIMIHGLPNGRGWIGPLHRLRNWTAGCVAVTDAEIREIWALVPDGTPVEILP